MLMDVCGLAPSLNLEYKIDGCSLFRVCVPSIDAWRLGKSNAMNEVFVLCRGG